MFNVNPDNGTVTAIHLRSLQRLWERRVGRKPRSLALDSAGRVWVAVQGDDRLVALDPSGEEQARIDLGHGRGPHGIAFVPGTDIALVTVPASGEVVKVDASSATVLARARVNAEPRGIAVTGDGHAYVTRFRSTTAGLVTKLDAETLERVADIPLAVDAETVDAEDRARGRPNYLTQVVVSPDGRTAWVPSKQDNVLRGGRRDGQALAHDATVRAVASQIDLASGVERGGSRIDFNDREGAHAVAFSPRGDYAFVALRGSNEVAVLDAYSGEARGVLAGGSGSAPVGLWIDAVRNRAFVHNYTSRSVAVYDIADVLASVSFEPPLMVELGTVAHEDMDGETLRGLRQFYDAADERMSREGYLSCASCHLDGGEDGAVWDFTDRGEGLRNTIALNGREGVRHGNLHWSANFDEVQDFENDIRSAFGGTGFLSDADYERTAEPLGAAKAGLDGDLDALARYVSSLNDFGRSPHRNASGAMSADALGGRLLFARSGCRGCHAGADFRDGRRHDVGTAGAGSGDAIATGGVDTPTLLDAWRTAPYFHDGSAATLEDVLESGHGGADELAATERKALAAYLKSLERGVEERVRVVLVPFDEQYPIKCWEAVAASGEYVMRGVCDGSLSQQWIFDQRGRLRPAEDDRLCVTGEPGGNSRLRLYQCGGGDWQRWTAADGAIRSVANQDFAVYGPDTRLPWVQLVMSAPRKQRWYLAYESTRPSVSSDTGLSALSVSGKRLELDGAGFDHEAAVAEGVTEVSVEAAPAHPAASASVRDADGALVDGPVAFPDSEGSARFEVAVVAQDGQAIDVHTVTVRRSALPGAPQGLRAELGNRQAALSWSPPVEVEAPVEEYEYRVDDGAWTTVAGEASARSVTVGGLANGTTYNLFVRAINGVGPGPEARVAVTLGSSEATLRDLAVSDVDIGTFEPGSDAYRGAAAQGLSVTTVTATPTDSRATVVVAPGDADANTAGHQVALGEGDNAISVTVTAADGTTERTYAVTVTRPAAPLTGRFTTVPNGHAGAGTEVTLRLAFSEPVALSYVTLRDWALEVTGGAVSGARRVDGRNDLWDIVVVADSDADLTVALPATSDCAASGAVCTGGGKPFSHALEATVPGPPEADGELNVTGVPQVGETLEAPELEGTGPTEHQWLRDGTEIAGATGSSHALTGSDEGAEISVRVTRSGAVRQSAATIPIWGAPGNPPLRAGEEELLGTLLRIGSTDAYPLRLAGYGRVSRASFGSIGEATLGYGGATVALTAAFLNGLGEFALGPPLATLKDAALWAYWDHHRIGPLVLKASTSEVDLLVAPTPQPKAAYLRHLRGHSDGVRVALSIRRSLPPLKATLSAPSAAVSEGADAAFEVSLDRSAGEPLEIGVEVTSEGEMLAGAAPSSVAVPAGSTLATLALATDDDSVVEGDGTVTATLLAGDGYALGGTVSATVAVEDDDAAEWTLAARPSELVEGGSAALNAEVTNGVTHAEAVTLGLSVAGDLSASDYELGSASLELAAGGSAVSTTLAALADGEAEDGAEAARVSLSSDGAEVASALVSIRDASSDAALSRLELSGADLGPFDPDATAYAATVAASVSSTTVTAEPADANAAVEIADANGSTAGTERTSTLSPGANAIAATVTAEDGETERTYAVTVTREAGSAWGERLPARDIELSGLSEPTGLWSDGDTLWASNWDGIRAYALAGGARRPGRDVAVLSELPSGLWSDGTTLWHSDQAGAVRAFRLSDGTRTPSADLPAEALAAAGNGAPAGLWSDASGLRVVDLSDGRLYGYGPDRGPAPGLGLDLRPLRDDNDGFPWGLWSDGSTALVTWFGQGTLNAFRLSDGAPLPDRDIDLGAHGNDDPRDLWSDGGTLWVADGLDGKLYAYAVPGLERPASSGLLPVRVRSRALSVPAADPGPAAAIPDPGLRARIAVALGKAPDAVVGVNELASLTALNARGAGIADLSGLEGAANLEALDLGGNPLADLRALARLPKLAVLNLDGTGADAWAVAGLRTLTRLSLRGNDISEVAPLSGLTRLKALDLGGNRIEDASPLANLGAQINLRGNPAAAATR